ncbi:alpha/beta hydrolase-fold protein [uncultured Pluralibacter sp.]|uniref:alpha/beta hydrolase n=1 Tax=uncultured Pluralibacter sp. TaxID=1490864 RepID=UPI00261F4979|nr:alpha/beta hydrolase-fold protein [uncultured Pluralibacter sp.]
MRFLSHHRQRTLPRATAFFLALLFTGLAHARPNMTPLGPNIADKGSALYHFTINTFDSADGQRHYKVWTAVPNKKPPAAGYPVLWTLDGNAVMNHLSDKLLSELSAGTPPVIVAVGYQTNLPFDVYARAWDYTPPVAGGDSMTVHGRKGGGDAAFQALIENTLAPVAEKGIPLNTAHRAIWGHSLGGIFALDTYYRSPFFSRIYATSPSLSQNYISLVTRLKTADAGRLSGKQLLVIEGSWPASRNPQVPEPASIEGIRSVLAGLSARGLPARLVQYPTLSHGEMFSVGLELALRDVAGVSTAAGGEK